MGYSPWGGRQLDTVEHTQRTTLFADTVAALWVPHQCVPTKSKL